MIQTLASDRADEPLGERILPRAMRRRQEGDHRTRIFSESEPADQPLPAGLNFGEGQVTVLSDPVVVGRWAEIIELAAISFSST